MKNNTSLAIITILGRCLGLCETEKRKKMHIKDIDKYSKLSLNVFQWDEKLLFNDLLILPIIGLIIGELVFCLALI